MYAQCPNCETFFQITSEQLRAAEGKVRCSRCDGVFNALTTLREELSTEDRRALNQEKAAARTLSKESSLPIGDLFAETTLTENEELRLEKGLEDHYSQEDAANHKTTEVEEAIDVSPDILLTEPRRKRWITASWAFASLILLLGLVAQLTHAYRHQLLSHSQLAPWLALTYEKLRIPLDMRRDLQKLVVLRSQVTSHAEYPDVLQITGVLVNRADYSQPYPELRVLLQDRWGGNLGGRYFSPVEYRHNTQINQNLMPPGKNIVFDLAIVDPGREAVGYQVDPCISVKNQYVCPENFTSR
ncbi:MAG: DUF3426 domain-containing protein [Gammaproteobacteria bacterium]|nr:DUF3426 domain-containing protein [Gammaproteobacteria bacterium]